MRVLYTIQGVPGERYQDFRKRILVFTESALAGLAGGSVVVSLTEEPAPFGSVIPFRRTKMALISLEQVQSSVKWPEPPPGFTGSWSSDAAYPVIHQRNWPLGERSPGVGLLTFFQKKKGLEENEFLKRWYDGHTPLTLEVHPNSGYVRNRVTGPVEHATMDADGEQIQWDGIVEEQYHPRKNLLNPARFFGGSVFKMVPTMLRVYRDVKGFIEYSSIHSWLTAEYRIKDRPSDRDSEGAGTLEK